MDCSADETCILVLQKDVFIQFQSIQLATKLDTNAQMEMFFQLYHCVMATHFRRDTLHNSGLKKARTNLPKEDSVNHETLPDPRRTENKIANCLADVSSKVKEQITSHLYNKSNYLPTNSNTIHLENDKHSVNNSLVDQNQVNISSTSDSYQELDELNSQQTQGNREASELDMNTSLHVGSTETSCSSGPDEQTGVPENQSVDSTGSSTSTSVRKGRRKSAPKRAAPMEYDDMLDMQLLLKQEPHDDGTFLSTVDMDPVANKDSETVPPNTEMTDSFLIQRYRKNSSFELPTMVHGTNYRSMISNYSPKKPYGKSSVNKNNHDMSKNNQQSSVSVEKQDPLKTFKGTDIKRESELFTDEPSGEGSPEVIDADILSSCGDTPEDPNSKTGVLKCDFCSFTSHRRYNLNRHRRIHTGNMFKCEKCDRKFNEPGKLKSHKCKIHIPKCASKLTYVCDICSTSGLKSVESLRQHVLSQHNIEETFVCVSCSSQVIFHDPQEFKNHLQSLHTVNSRNLSYSICNECGREFKYLRSLQKHKENCVISMYKTNTAATEPGFSAL